MLTPVSPPVLPETLVLRFRDLATDPGETIDRHHDICAREGRVWWGWWHKAREHVPVAAFAHINERAKGDGLDIYLLNAHERRVHRARLLKIHWKDDLEPFTSPFPWFTPGYYRGRRCKVWFELSKVEPDEMSFDPLNELVQVSVPEFFRGDDRGMVALFSTSQVISLVLAPLSVIMLFWLSRAPSAPSAPATRPARA